MKSKAMRIAMVIFLIGMVSLLSACGKSEPTEPVVDKVQQPAPVDTEVAADAEPIAFALHGDYAIDITNLGMALKFYLRINEDNTFVLSANRQFSDDRGSGTIGELDGTYLMIYSDSTPDRSKTATFERVGPNLVFRSTLPYGSANISFEKEDDEDPEIVYHLTADKYVYEEYYDTYLGFSSMDGVEYEYVLNLGAGAKYQFVSKDGETAVYNEGGSFRVADGSIMITPQDEVELVGSITDDGALEIEVKPTAAADRAKTVFRVATTAQHAGLWYAQNDAGAKATLELDYFSGYKFSTVDGGEAYSEQGTFEISQGTIAFTREGQEDSVSGTKEGYILKASFNSLEWNFFDAAVQGQFKGSTMVNESYVATLDMKADGSYALRIVDEESDSAQLVDETGAFTITAGPMSYMISLNSEDEVTRVGAIWPTGLNMTFDIDGTSYSFLLTK